ncbi:ion transporter [Parvibaculum sp.]|uniref:ion transporter n=1 Tax=Parvibaculum sp. TaxID=2024848 RepID=UPI001B1CE662|nr:ion transporter [Parvibaculum sp.]MBO6633851.1 ion transporter [Parvibaculum sp.]MBO6678937.1 ion transporter [Parvibaculum sp.]MBO6685544.1 ion transporter [Parvibaculum sp.]MBO6904349.1 ion transporter [Parvibaculum sp.]
MKRSRLVDRLREHYEGTSEEAEHFRYGLLIFDVVTILFIVVTSFTPRPIYVEIADAVIGVLILADFIARFLIDRNRMRSLLHPVNIADMVAVISFLAPVVGEGLGFLRVLRTVRLLRTYRTLQILRQDFKFFRANEEVIIAAVNLCVFIFVMTGLVYETQHYTNKDIDNYADAVYFTVTALTTTGFGDITLPGTSGRLLSVIIMIFGVTLFLRLAQVLFRPNKVTFECPECGLLRHEPDAVHCKHCGTTIHITTEGHG